VSGASLLLLDEPTASLDAVSVDRVIDAIRAAARQRTTVFVTHDPALAAVADRVIELQPRRPPEAAPLDLAAGRR
jgi:ABC-type transport system involved in cytochrome bd biosynthesis fused ATPase/permease subunit